MKKFFKDPNWKKFVASIATEGNHVDNFEMCFMKWSNEINYDFIFVEAKNLAKTFANRYCKRRSEIFKVNLNLNKIDKELIKF